MSLLTHDQLRTLLNERNTPCISLFQPTHRHHPDNQQDPIRFKNLMRTVEDSLRQKYPTRDIREMMQPFQDLAADPLFWNHTRDGLAVLACPGTLKVFLLQRTLPERAVVADSFHIKALCRYVQSADRFHVLALTRTSAKVFEGNRSALDDEPLPADFPGEASPTERGKPGVSVASSSAGVGSPKVVYGHGEDKTDADTEKYFRAVDRAVMEHFSKPTGLPLILAALPEHQAMFRAVARNPQLMPNGVPGNPAPLTNDQLRAQVWQVLEPEYLKRLDGLKELFSSAQARQAGSADLSDVARQAVAGRVGKLLVEAERVIPGIVDPSSGAIQFADLGSPEVDDMLDDVAELVLTRGGEVIVVPAERMPTSSGLAAIYRY